MTLGGIFKFYSKFLATLQTRTTRSAVKYFIVSAFPLSGQSNYVVEEFSAERQRAIISWGHYLTTYGEAGSGDSLTILHQTHSDIIPRLKTVQSHFQTEGEKVASKFLWPIAPPV